MTDDQLLPAEDAEGDQVNNQRPGGHNAQLRADVNQRFAFGGDQAGTVNDWGQRHKGGHALQPFRHQVAREEDAG